MKGFGRYLLWQALGWVVVGLALVVAVGLGLPTWAAALVAALVVARDLLMYPVIRSAFDRPPYRAVPIGSLGEVVEPLGPSGYVRVGGELWRATLLSPAARLPAGARVVVREARGLTLLVDPRAAGRD